jgi:hypothetical protein
MRAWRREASGSSTTTSHSSERPTITAPEVGNGKDANASRDMTSTARPSPDGPETSPSGSEMVVFALIGTDFTNLSLAWRNTARAGRSLSAAPGSGYRFNA